MAGMPDTMQDNAFVSALAQNLVAGKTVVLSTVLSTRRSMPRDASARMALLEDGTFLGTVGGGAIERMTQERSRELMAEALADPSAPAAAEYAWHNHEETKMACGGDALVGIRVLKAPDAAFFQALEQALLTGEPVFIEEQWAPGGTAYTLETDAAKLSLAVDPTSAGTAWDEATATYIEVIAPLACCYIFGAGHVAQALAPIVQSVGFVPKLYDDRVGMAHFERLGSAFDVEIGPYDKTAEAAPITGRDYVVVTTQGHNGDICVLKHVMPKHPSYVGCIGSRKKRGTVDGALIASGIDPDYVKELRLPVGLEIGAVTPQEIAISIVGELIQHRASLAARTSYCPV